MFSHHKNGAIGSAPWPIDDPHPHVLLHTCLAPGYTRDTRPAEVQDAVTEAMGKLAGLVKSYAKSTAEVERSAKGERTGSELSLWFILPGPQF